MKAHRSIANITKQIVTCKKHIAAERDKLRELLDEAYAIAENCDDAIADLERAVDCLSQYM